MNNRILATLFALAIALFIGVAPVEAEAAHTHVDNNGNCNCDYCSEAVHAPQYVVTENGHILQCQKCNAIVTNLGAHTYTFAPKDAQKHVGTCSECGKVVTQDHVDADKDCVCDDCGRGLTHKLVKVAYVAETCTENGIHGHQKCETCGSFFTTDGARMTEEQTIIKAPGHNESTTWYKDETSHWHVCKNTQYKCDEKLSEAAHTLKWSGESNGHYQYCEECGYATVTFEDHDYVRTPKGDNKHETKCKDCGYIMGGTTQNCVDTDTDKDCVCDGCGGTMDHTSFNLENTSRFTVVHKTATCTEDGILKHYQCNFCGIRLQKKTDGSIVELNETTMVNPASGHKLVWNHNSAGHYQVCENMINGKQCEYKTEVAEHDYVYTNNGNSTHDARCSVCNRGIDNETHYDSDTDNDCVCDGAGCDHVMTHFKSDLTIHLRKEATCLTDGNKGYFSCDTCGGIFTGNEEKGYTPYEGDYVLKALGHDWEFSGKAGDLHWATCKRDGCNVKENLPHTDTNDDCLCDLDNCGELVHSHELVFVPQVDATCGKAGTKAYYKYKDCGKMFDMNQKPISAPVEIPALAHVAGNDYEAIEGDMHAIKCSNCGEVMTTAAHADSNEDNRCDVCNVELALEYVEQQDPTCTGIGYEGYWVSKYTGRKYADAYGNVYITEPEVIPSLDHIWTDANASSHICGRCGATAAHVNQDSIECICDACYRPVSGHVLTFVDEVEATCTKSGTMAYVKCECGKMYELGYGKEIKSAIVIPSSGHRLASTVVNDTATGEHYSVCTVCGKKVYSEHETVLEDPLKGNYHQWVCECGYSDPVTHKDTDGDNKCDECGHDMANTPVNVEQHDSVTVITGEKETVDNSKSWLWNWIDKLLPGTSGGTSTSSNAASGSAPASSGNALTSGGSNPASSGDVLTSGGSNPASSGDSTPDSSGDISTPDSGTGIINEFIQWLSQLFNVFLQSI